MPEYKLYAVRIFSFKWEEALAFYRDVLAFPLAFADPELGWAQFQVGPAYLGLERCEPDDEEAQALVGRFVGTSIEVDNIQNVYNQLLEKGVVFTSAPTKQAWGGILAHFEDPDGNVLTLLGTDD